MATYTPNYSLKKPAQEDSFDIDDANQNMDILDTQLFTLAQNLSSAATQSTLTALAEVIGTTKDEGGNTAAGTTMAKLNAILTELSSRPPSAIKSVQRGVVFLSNAGNEVDSTHLIALSEINPEKSSVSIYGNGSSSGHSGYPLGFFVSSLSETMLTVVQRESGTRGLAFNKYFSWEVVEYY
jgi:Flp pilus assembly protein TadG